MGYYLSKIYYFFEIKPWRAAVLLFLISLGVFSYLQATPYLADPDSAYHIKIAEMMSVGGPVKSFPYLPFTALNDNYIDHHFFYHVLLVPFVRYLPPLVGAKVAQAILGILVVMLFYWLLRRFKVTGALWWSLILFSSQAFLFRLDLIKAQPLSIAILLLGVYLIINNKRWWLFFLSFIYVWTYGGWFLLLISVFVYAIIEAISKISARFWPITRQTCGLFFKSISTNGGLLLGVFGGTIFGLVFNPYFPRNLYFYWAQVVQIGLFNFQGQIQVGNEWYPTSVLDVFTSSGLILILFIFVIIVVYHYRRRFNTREKYLVLLAVLFFLVTIKSRRNIEYFIPFSLLATAVIFNVTWHDVVIRGDFLRIKEIIKEWVIPTPMLKRFFQVVVVFTLSSIFICGIIICHRQLSRYQLKSFAAPALFLRNTVPPQQIIFHDNWDEFPLLFYYNEKNYYISGLDPTFFYLKNRDLYQKYDDIVSGREKDKLSDIIKNDFNTDYIFATDRNKKLLENLEKDSHFEKIYWADGRAVFRILP